MSHQKISTFAFISMLSLRVFCLPHTAHEKDSTTSPSTIFERQEFVYCPVKPPFFRFATFGDSYASGVTWGSGCASGHCNGRANRDYDFGNPGEIERCRRNVDAYASRLKDDCSWTNNTSPYLDWPACSGSTLPSISGQVNGLFRAQELAGPANVSNFATLQIGGNDVGFYQIAARYELTPL